MDAINNIRNIFGLHSYMPINSMPIEKTIAHFTGDFTSSQKSQMTVRFLDDNALSIAFQNHLEFSFTIRRQDIFTSGAQVIVNAANTHLGGGGGIDGAIHARGGASYAKAHQELQKLYHAKYELGHAAMIASGELKQKHRIENVIVVAGPQGTVNTGKETELYSCYYNSLLLAQAQKKASIAFPSISTGIFGFDKDRAAAISMKAVWDFIERNPNSTVKAVSIHFLPSDPKRDLEIYQAAATA